MPSGRLVVFEGPDGSGKSTLHDRVSRHMPCGSTLPLAFPGNRPRSLGKLVHDIHHGAHEGLDQPPQAPLQLLHIAAHLETIERFIRPALEAGSTVLLDRYWWSTWVYGTEGGVSGALLEKMIDVERLFLGDLSPDIVFLLLPPEPYREEISDAKYTRLAGLYRGIADHSDCPVEVMDEQMTLHDAFVHVTNLLAFLAGGKGAE